MTGNSAERPNIILFVPDEMRADSLGCYGNPIVQTPNFDRLAREGTRFANCHVQFPVCGASRCSMMTGWPASVRGHRSLFYFLRPDEPNLFRYLKQSGYDVYWFGKNDLLSAQSFYDSVTYWSGGVFRAPEYRPLDVPEAPGATTFLYGSTGDRRETWDYGLVRSAIDILKRTEAERPFCIFLPMTHPHPPYAAPTDFHDLYAPADVPDLIPPGLPRKPEFHEALRALYRLDRAPEAVFRRIRATYYGQVSYSDWLLGEILEAIEESGHTDDTALFAFSDHGDYAGDYGLAEKWPSGLEDALTRVPLIARIPGGRAAHTVNSMVEAFDVMATCLELAGVQAEHTHFARSLMPQLLGGPGDSDRAAFAEGGYNTYEPQCFEPQGSAGSLYANKILLQNSRPETISRAAMVRTQAHKLILRPQGQSELYDLEVDPREENNLYSDHVTAKIQEALQLRLLSWYLNTTGVAPLDKDQRGLPPFYASASFGGKDTAAILDRQPLG